MNFNVEEMRVLAIGINPSKRKGIPIGTLNWRSNSPPDKIINGALTILFRNNYDFTDVINKQISNIEFKNLSDEEKSKLCEENRENLLKNIEKFKPDCILILSKSDFYKGFTEFVNSLKKQVEVPIVRIYHPSPVVRYKRFKSIEEYAEDIREAIRKEWKKKIMKKQRCEECKKKKILYAKGKCVNCYRRLMYRGLPKKEKKRRYNVSKIWREKNKEKVNRQMRDVMRKRLNIKPKNYYKK